MLAVAIGWADRNIIFIIFIEMINNKWTKLQLSDKLLDNFSNGKLRWKVDNFPEGVTVGAARKPNHSESSLEKKLGSILTLAILKSTMASF